MDGLPRRLVYGAGGPIDIRLPCGGRVELLVERIIPGDPAVSALLKFSEERMPSLWISDGQRRLCFGIADYMPSDEGLRTAFLAARQDVNRAGCRAEAIHRLFTPRQRLVVFGHDPTVLAMAMLAQQVGMETILVRPRGPTTPPSVSGIDYRRERPDVALAAIGADPWTAVAVAMHQEEDDHDALAAALSSKAGYVGLLGSSRHLPRKLARLAAAGVSPARLKCLKAPVGLKIGGHSPWEIATSVIAEVIQTMNERPIFQSYFHSTEAA